MNFGFPGANTNFENHNVSEESFWPSFTDIMMVIVMVFLLVAVSVILNNFQLVENLKKSMQAQQIASSIAEDAQVENSSLEERVLQLKQQLALLSTQIVDAKKEATNYQVELKKREQIIKELNAISAQKDKQLDTKTTFLAQLEEQSKQQLDKKNAEIIELNNTQQAQAKELEAAQKKAAIQQQQLVQLQQQDKQKAVKEVDLQEQIKALQSSLKENASQYSALQSTLQEQMTAFDELQKQRQTDETQLLSLQGELDSLDKKYQKLLRPARSEKGKYVVSVIYTKRKGHGVYRLRVNAKGEYINVSRKQLERKLLSMKNKHGTNLYVKVIIPENSGLSYNDAWKFTSAMQKSYDYYFQDDGDEGNSKQ
jgi:chromosome segregation ATPase